MTDLLLGWMFKPRYMLTFADAGIASLELVVLFVATVLFVKTLER